MARFLIRWRADGIFDGLYLSITCAEDVPFIAADAGRARRTDLSWQLPRARAACRLRRMAARGAASAVDPRHERGAGPDRLGHAGPRDAAGKRR